MAQVAISELQDLTGLNFGILATKDHFAEKKGGDPGTLEIAAAGGGKRKIKQLLITRILLFERGWWKSHLGFS